MKYLEKYKMDNQKRFSERFQSINRSIEEMIREAKHRGGMNQEIKILEAIRKGFIASPAAGETMSGKFFMLNQRKLEALIKSVTRFWIISLMNEILLKSLLRNMENTHKWFLG